MILNCIAVDDEPLALGLICSFIEQTPFLNLAGKFASGVIALEFLHDNKIDVIFLDIQMPDLTGIQMARLLENQTGIKPRVVFTTAFNNYAIEGYKVDALDYLLKPFDYEEFLKAANKARAYTELVHQEPPVPIAAEEEYIFLKVEYQLLRISIKDIIYIEGLKDYAKIHLSSDPKPVLSLITLKSLEEKLPARRFMRVHRSFIITLDKIESITKNTVHIGGIMIAVGDQYKDTFNLHLRKWI